MSKPNLVVLLSGKQGSGKTTIATHLRQLAAEIGYVTYRLRFAEPLYALHDALLPVAKRYDLVPMDCDKDGTLLQLLGTEWGRKTKGENCWVDILRRDANLLLSFGSGAFITIEDARFPNEFEAFPDALRVRLNCDREIRKARTHSWRDNENHASETGLDAVADAKRFDLYLRTETDAVGVAKVIFATAQTAKDNLAEIRQIRDLL